MLTTTYRINGRVQGVGFRFTTMMVAKQLHLTGTVKNESDGSVTIVLNADASKRDEFITALKEETRRGFAQMSTIDILSEEEQSPFDDFRVVYR